MQSICRIMVLIIILFMLVSCGYGIELQEMCIITGAAIDLNEDGGILLTVEIADFDSSSSKTNDSDAKDTLFTSEGKSLTEAMSMLNRQMDKYIFWGHNKVFIFGRTIAEQGLNKYIDALLRNNDIRPTAFIVIAEDMAQDIIHAKCGISPIVSYGISGLFSNNGDFGRGSYIGCNIGNYCEILLNDFHISALPMLSLSEEKSDKEDKESSSPNIVLNDYIIIDQDGKETLILNTEEQIGMAIISNKLHNAMLTIKDENIIYSNMLIKPKTSVKINNGKILIDIKAECKLYEISNSSNSESTIDVDKITALTNDKLKSIISQILDIEQKNSCDFLLLHKYAEDQTDIYSAEYDINTDVKLLYMGDLFDGI